MSNEETNTPTSKATNVADDARANIIESEFVIVSNKDCVDEVSTTAKAKKITSKDQNKKKGGPSAKTLSLIREQQQNRIEAELQAAREAEETRRLEKEREEKEQERLRLEKECQDKKKEKIKKRIQQQKSEGSYLTKKQREKHRRAQIQLEPAGIHVPARDVVQSTASEVGKTRILYDDQRKINITSSNATTQIVTVDSEVDQSIEAEGSSKDVSEEDSEEENMCHEKFQILKISKDSDSNDQLEVNTDATESDSTDDGDNQLISPMERVRRRLERYHEQCESHRSSEVLRAPVICVLGHVDAGKTTLLDNLRHTHVQDNEAGGITQQIGATNVPLETLHERTKMCRKLISRNGAYIVPGLLIIDTPGHELFQNLRSRGSSLCDLAILVVDIMHGLAPQILQSIRLLIENRTPFIIALNKIDLLYGWKSDNRKNIELVLEEQSVNTKNHFEKRCNEIIVQFAEQGLNVALYYKNSDPTDFYSMVPTSAHTGDGMGSLIGLIIETSQTCLAERLSYTNELQATVIEVKTHSGLGTTIDVVLVAGCLSVGDKIVIAGYEAPIVTQIRGILMPESNQELRATNQYKNNIKAKGACSIKILAKDLEKSMVGLPLFIARREDEVDYFKNKIEIILSTALNSFQTKDEGVYVQTSTLGSLEAFVELLKTHKILYSGINIGPVHRKDVIRASAQLEKDPKWATILAFDVKVEREAQEYANTMGVKIFQHDEVYQLYQMFVSYQEQRKKDIQDRHRHLAVFPCILKIFPQYVFKSRDPIVCGVLVEDGFLTLGTPICVPSRDGLELGRVVSIEKNHKILDRAVKGSEVCIKIDSMNHEAPKMFGRHFDENDILMSKITRQSIDIVKEYFRDDMKKSDWMLIIELKKILNII